MQIPAHGRMKDDILAAVEAARSGDFPWRDGRLYAYVFDGGPDVEEVGKKAYMAYLSENGLDPTTFPSLLRFENDLVDMARNHLGGDSSVVGNFTSGGTESIILAVKTARDWFKEKHPHSHAMPELVVPLTAHSAFHKAAHYLGVKLVVTEVDPVSFRADPDAMLFAMNEHTMMVVASASSYAHGVVDPVAEIAAMAQERGVLCHVDGCMGGFLLPYFRRIGAKVPDFDFHVPGVTSMSMDFHKYALCPKGASVVLYRGEDLRRHQIFVCSEWTGYTMINNTVQSSKSGGPMAAAWAVLQFVGDAGYLDYATHLLAAKNAVVEGVGKIAGLRVMGEPEMSLVAFTSDEVSVFAVADAMKARGWYVQVQFACGPSKENLHLSINPGNTRWTGEMLAALAESVEEVRAAGGGPKVPVELAAMLAEQVRLDTDGTATRALVRSLAGEGGNTPTAMAELNTLLNEIPAEERGKLLRAFVGDMFTPRGEG